MSALDEEDEGAKVDARERWEEHAGYREEGLMSLEAFVRQLRVNKY